MCTPAPVPRPRALRAAPTPAAPSTRRPAALHRHLLDAGPVRLAQRRHHSSRFKNSPRHQSRGRVIVCATQSAHFKRGGQRDAVAVLHAPVAALLEAGGDPRSSLGGAAPLQPPAAQVGHATVLLALVEAGVDVGGTDSNAWAPLHLPAAEGLADGPRRLLELGAAPQAFCSGYDGAGGRPRGGAAAAGRGGGRRRGRVCRVPARPAAGGGPRPRRGGAACKKGVGREDGCSPA